MDRILTFARKCESVSWLQYDEWYMRNYVQKQREIVESASVRKFYIEPWADK